MAQTPASCSVAPNFMYEGEQKKFTATHSSIRATNTGTSFSFSSTGTSPATPGTDFNTSVSEVSSGLSAGSYMFSLFANSDAKAEGDETITMDIAFASDPAFTCRVSITLKDGPVPGITVRVPAAVGSTKIDNLVEQKEARPYTMKLTRSPGSGNTVTVTASSGDPSAVGVGAAKVTSGAETHTLTFTSSDWDTEQTVMVSAINDSDSDDETGVMITHTLTATGTNNPFTDAADLASVTVDVKDNDASNFIGITVSPTLLDIFEGQSATYTVVLDRDPVGTVTIRAFSNQGYTIDTNASQPGDQSDLEFDSTNFSTAQTVTVTALTDPDLYDSLGNRVRHEVIGGTFNGSQNTDLVLNLKENLPNAAGISLIEDAASIFDRTPDTNLRIYERFFDFQAYPSIALRRYVVRLDTAPTSDVVITVGNPDSGAVAVDANDDVSPGNQSTLTITPANWRRARYVEVRPVEDADQRDESVVLTHTASSSDANYNNIQIGSMTVQVVDTRVHVSTTSLSLTEGNTGTYTLRLNSAPLSVYTVGQTLTLTATTSDSSAVVVDIDPDTAGDQSTLTITTNAGWNNERTVTVRAEEDGDMDDEQNISITHTATGSDSNMPYHGIAIPSVRVDVTDNDNSSPVAQFASGSSSAGESASTRNVTINLNPAPSNAITVNYTLSGSATRGTDYTISGVTSNSGSVSVSAGATSATIPVAITDDNANESNETVILTLAQGNGYTLGSVNAHTLTIIDNDGPAHSLSPTEIYEGERLTFTFSTNHAGANVGVWFRLGPDTLGSTAAYATDYHAYRVGSNAPFQIPNTGGTGGQFTLSNGQLQFDIQALTDSAAESDETIMVAFYNSGGSAQITRETITLKNGARPGSGTVAQFASGSSSAAESAGTRNVAINLNPAPSNAITLNYTVGGTASEGGSGDFTIANSGTVSVSANASSVNIPVALRDDTTDEPRETVVLTLTQGSGYTVGSTNAHTLTITDNDITTVTLSTPDTTAEEQNSGNTATLRLALNRGLEAGESLAVPLRFSGGTAGTHFRLACPTPRPTGVTCANLGNANAAVTFTGPGSGASATAVSLTLSVPNDDGDTSDRTVTASIPASTSGNPRLTATGLGGGASGSRSGNGQIVLADDDTVRPTVTISAGSGVTEGTAASFTVSTSTTLTVALSVRVRVDDVPGSDFVASGAQGVRTVTIPANQALANFSVSTVGDSTDEASGPVSASVVNHASYVVGSPGTASVTVTDNDATTATLAGPAGDVREGNAKVLTLTLNRGLRSGESLTAPLSFAGAAVRNTDYTLTGAPATGVAYNNLNSGTATVVFTGPNAGASAAVARITLRATADGAAENPEAADIGLGSLTPSGLDGGANGVDSLASFNIEDPPPVRPTVRFSSAASRAPEDAGTRNVTINLSPAPNTSLTLRYTVGGNAAGGDFSIANSGTLSVDPGDTAATITVTITDDIEDENDETVVLTLTSDATYTIGSPSAHTLTIGDDDTTPVAAFVSGASSVGESAGTVSVAVRLTPPPQEDVTVNYAVADGTATAGSDYTRPSGTTLSFATGTATATIAIPIIDDNAAEGAETVVLTLGGCTGCTLGRATQHTLTIRSSDNPPTASDGTAATRPGQAYAFQVQDFGYRDPDGDALAHVTVVTLPAQGTLELGGTPVTAGAQIPQARIASGDLTFTPESGEKGDPYTSFTFTVNDGSAASAASYTLTLDVRNDPPEAADGEVQLRQGRPHTFRVEDFEAGYSDADGDRLAGIVIVAPPGKGMLALSGMVVTTNDVSVTRGELEMGELTFTATPGESGSPYTDFHFKVNDGFEDSPDSAKMTLHVQSVAAGRMIEQWLARFGRTVADQVIDAVEERLNNPQPPAQGSAMQLRLAGRDLDSLRPLEGGQPPGAGHGPDDLDAATDPSLLSDARDDSPAHAVPGISGPSGPVPGRDRSLARSTAGGLGTDLLPARREAAPTGLPELDWLGGSSFHYARGDADSGLTSVWGRGAVSQFDGRDGSARVDGRVESLMLGADFMQDGRTLGALLSHSRGEGDYRGESGGRFDSDLTGIYPYARHEINDQLSVWGVAGYGEGDLELRREASTEETDLELWMVAGGLRGRLCAGGWGWPELSAVADVLWVDTKSDALGETLPAVDAEVSRVRVGLEGTWQALPLGDGQLSPRLRLSLRHDGGDAEQGFGTEVRAGLGWTDARRGLSAQLQAHALLTHEEGGAQEKGISGSLAWDPRPDSLRGVEFSLTARTGAEPEREGLLAHDSFEREAPRETTQAWQAALGYGMGAFGDRFTAVPQARLSWSGDARDLGLGWRLVADEFTLLLEAVRRDLEAAGPDSRVRVQLQGRW